jgi:RNA 3'-terminal phosphate cyclase-like protein
LIPILKHFGVDQPSIEVKKRGLYPNGGGHISVYIPYIRELESVSLTDEGKVKRIRGVAYSCNVNPTLATRMIDSIRNVFNDYIPDVWVHCDHYKNENAGLSKGYGVSIIAETTTDCLISTDKIYNIGDVSDPEKLGESAAMELLDEIYYSGITDIRIAPSILLLMGLSSASNASDIKLPSTHFFVLTIYRKYHKQRLRDKNPS